MISAETGFPSLRRAVVTAEIPLLTYTLSLIHISITVETTTACDIPQVKEDKQVCALGKGPVVSFMDKGTVYDMDLYTKAMACAQRNNIPCQAKAGVYGGNESRSVQAAGKGCRVLAVSVPCRYLHTPSCVIKEEDMENTLRLLEALLDEFGA